ncbi:MAG: lytic transglycosylase domain-containing protein, partial [Polyangiaceae bacterium]
QLMPETAASLGVTNAYEPDQNVWGGARYLRSMLDRFGGDVTKAVAAYNAGPNAVERYGGVPPYAETQSYVENVLGSYQQYKNAPQNSTPTIDTTR